MLYKSTLKIIFKNPILLCLTLLLGVIRLMSFLRGECFEARGCSPAGEPGYEHAPNDLHLNGKGAINDLFPS